MSTREQRLQELLREAAGCRACPLWKDATQTVFGEGPAGARLMLVGEQPGDHEDIEGHPFVGPAGGILDQAIEQAGIDRSSVFLTNGVKHFKYRMRGKRRIHQRPSAAQATACRHWLLAEADVVEPELIVAMGATAAYSLIGRATPIGKNRGALRESPYLDPPVLITTHPSSVLRERDSTARRAALDALAEDLSQAVRYSARPPRR